MSELTVGWLEQKVADLERRTVNLEQRTRELELEVAETWHRCRELLEPDTEPDAYDAGWHDGVDHGYRLAEREHEHDTTTAT